MSGATAEAHGEPEVPIGASLPPLRDRVLGWQPGDGWADVWTTLLLGEANEAFLAWFGPDASCWDHATQRHAIDRDLLAIDRMVAAQLDAILHNPRFQALEAGWRGLRWLVDQVENGPSDRIVVRVLPATWAEIDEDLGAAGNAQDSHLGFLIEESELGTAGGEPFGMMVLDHALRPGPVPDDFVDDPMVLERFLAIAVSAMMPVLVAASPALLDVESFCDLAQAVRPASSLAEDGHRGWRRLREMKGGDSKFLAVVLPRMLARPPWRGDEPEAIGLRYRERAATVADRLWMNGAFGFAAVAARAASRYGWLADVRGADADRVGGGLVTGLPRDPHVLSPTLHLPRLPTEIVFSADQERMLIEGGLMPFGALPHGEDLLFSSVRSAYRLPDYAEVASNTLADSRTSTQFNALLCASRFGHFLRVKGRQAIGRLRQPEAIEAELQDWLGKFVNSNAQVKAAARAEKPLYNGRVQVRERDGMPGVFSCTIELQPYFQLDNVSASFHFETSLGQPASAQGGSA